MNRQKFFSNTERALWQRLSLTSEALPLLFNPSSFLVHKRHWKQLIFLVVGNNFLKRCVVKIIWFLLVSSVLVTSETSFHLSHFQILNVKTSKMTHSKDNNKRKRLWHFQNFPLSHFSWSWNRSLQCLRGQYAVWQTLKFSLCLMRRIYLLF